MTQIAYTSRDKTVTTDVVTAEDYAVLSRIDKLPIEQAKKFLLELTSRSKAKPEKKKLDTLTISRLKTSYQIASYAYSFILAGEKLSVVKSKRFETRELARGF